MNITLKSLIKYTLLIAGILIILVNGGLFLYYNYYFKQDVLIKYFPKDTVLYVNGAADAQLLENESVANILRESGLEPLYKDKKKILNGLIENAISFGLVPVSVSSETRLEPLLVFDLGITEAGDEIVSQLHERYGLKSRRINNNFLQRNVAIFSTSAAVLNRVQDIVAQRSESLAQNSEIVIALQPFTSPYRARGFFHPKALTRLKKLDSKISLLSAAISDAGIDTVYFGMRITDEGNIIVETPDGIEPKSNGRVLFPQVPNDTTAYLKTSTPILALGQFFSELQKVDPILKGELLGVKNFIEGTYLVDLQNEIAPLLDSELEIVATPQGVAIAIPILGDQKRVKEMIGRVIKEYLAVSNPIEQEFELKDRSTGIEIVKNYSNISENRATIRGVEVNTLALLNDSFSYFIRGDVLYVGNNDELVRSIVNSTNTSEIATIFPCDYVNGSEIALLSGSFLSQYNDFWSSVENIGIITSDHNGSPHIQLCF